MESKLIYAASEALKLKVKWHKATPESEWIYFGEHHDINSTIIIDSISKHFKEENLYVSFARQKSFEIYSKNFLEAVKDFLGTESFIVWNKEFQRAMEFNRIGVMRLGEISGS